jgi:predicted kinase
VAIVHLICGGTGAGKTTYAMAIATRSRAVRLSLDEWMGRLFAADAPRASAGAVAWLLERTARCEAQMWAVAEELLARQVDIVFDGGLATREDRDRLRLRALQLGAEPKLHYLDVDRPTRRARVRRRDHGTGAASALALSDEMFDEVERHFEPPSDDELYEAMIVCESEAPGVPTVT